MRSLTVPTTTIYQCLFQNIYALTGLPHYGDRYTKHTWALLHDVSIVGLETFITYTGRMAGEISLFATASNDNDGDSNNINDNNNIDHEENSHEKNTKQTNKQVVTDKLSYPILILYLYKLFICHGFYIYFFLIVAIVSV